MDAIKTINISLEVFGGLLSLIMIFCLFLTEMKKDALINRFIRILTVNTILLSCDAAAWFFKGRTDSFSIYAVHISNFLVFTLGYVLLAVFTDYLVTFVSGKDARLTRAPARIMWLLAGIAIVLVIISQFNHMYYYIDDSNMYHRQDWFWLSQIWGIICMLLNGSIIWKYRKSLRRNEVIALSSYILLPIVAMFIQIFFYGIALLYLATTLSVLCIYMGVQVEQAERFRKAELEVQRKQTEIMLSQIQPHFLFNSLTSIRQLCDIDPKKAKQAITNFSYYLRGNMEVLDAQKCIPFEREWEHVKNYLSLEQMRFEDTLHVEYHCAVTDFTLPPLTIQPMVENAVRHGINKNKGGGTVSLRTEDLGDRVVITIADDGAGFDPKAQLCDGRRHVGISNVRSRLESMCGGTLEIQSEPGAGTAVFITIYK